jgi:hypothetical protein
VLFSFVLYWLIALIVPAFADSNITNFWMGFIVGVLWLVTTIWPTLYSTYKYQKEERSIMTASASDDRVLKVSTSELALPSEVPTTRVSRREMLLRVLKDESGHDLFTRYLKKEFALENILFWDAVELIRTEASEEAKDYETLFRQCSEIGSKFVAKDAW